MHVHADFMVIASSCSLASNQLTHPLPQPPKESNSPLGAGFGFGSDPLVLNVEDGNIQK